MIWQVKLNEVADTEKSEDYIFVVISSASLVTDSHTNSRVARYAEQGYTLAVL